MLLFIFILTLTAMTFTVIVWGLEALDFKKKEKKFQIHLVAVWYRPRKNPLINQVTN